MTKIYRSLVLFGAALATILSSATAFAADTWEDITPAGTSGDAFLAIGTMADYVYLGTDDGLYRSINAGTSWSAINTGLTNLSANALAIGFTFDVSEYTVSPSTPVFVGTNGGLFKSTIGDTTWSQVGSGLTDTTIYDVQFDQSMVVQGFASSLYVATPSGVFRSDDEGATWLLVNTGMEGESVKKLSTDYGLGVIYALTTTNKVYSSALYSVSTVDESWTEVYDGGSTTIRDISPIHALSVYTWLATDAGVRKSDQNGGAWAAVNSGLFSGRINTVASDYLDFNIAYAAAQGGGIYRTVNEALSSPAWDSINVSLTDTTINDISTNPTTSLLVHAVGSTGVYRLELSDPYVVLDDTPVVDTTAPTVAITVPTASATFSGTTTVTATATDTVGVVGVQFKLNGANLGAEDTSAPYTISWGTLTSANGAYTLTAVARDAAGNTATSTGVSVTVSNSAPDTTAPTVPTGLAVTPVSANQINLTWNNSTDAVGVAGYRVMRRPEGGSFSLIATTGSNSYSDSTGVSPLLGYTYRVSAYDAANNISANSSNVTATSLPSVPANLAATVVSTSQINLSWTASSEAVSGYEVYRGGVLVTTVTHPTTTYADTGLAANTTYSYTIRAVATIGFKSVASSAVSAKTQSGSSSSGGGGGGGGSSTVRGCTDKNATNYSRRATRDNGTCTYAVVQVTTSGTTTTIPVITTTSGTVSSNIPGHTFTVVMGLGSRGIDVVELQKVLTSLGYFKEEITGYYGSVTEAAVKRFQADRGLETVGSVGPQSRAALNQITGRSSSNTPAVSISVAEQIRQLLLLVLELQRQLALLQTSGNR